MWQHPFFSNNEVSGVTAYFQELFSFGFYKRSQGRIARQVTLIAFAIVVAVGCLSLKATMETADSAQVANAAVPTALVLFAIGCWAAFRLVHLPVFADFLISVEAEMSKVSWPARPELFKATVVVILTIFVLAGLLFAYDALWKWVLGFVL